MHKLIITIVIILAVSTQLIAQKYEYVPFPDSGAVWSEMYTSEKTGLVYERFALSGEDTVINDISYKKLYIFYDKTFDKTNAKFVGGIREDEHKRVYFKGDSLIHHYKPFWVREPPVDEMLLYDFSRGIGDTIMFDLNNGIFLCVKSIDTVQIGDRQRKVFKFEYTGASWIEGIGNTRGLLFSSFSLSTGTGHGDLICFLQNNTVQYHNDYYDDCFPNRLSVDNIQANLNVTVSMNRSEKLIQFKWGNCKITKIELFNIQGTLVNVLNVTKDSTEANCPTAEIQSGIYIFRATDSNGYAQTGRFVVK